MVQLQDEISTALWKPELTKVSQHLKCSEPAGVGFKGQSQSALIQLAESTLDKIEKAEESEVFQQFIHDLQSFVQSLQEHPATEVEIQRAELSEIERLKQEYSQLQQAQAEARRVLEDKIEALGTEFRGAARISEKQVSQPTPFTTPEVTLSDLGSDWGSRTKRQIIFH